LVSWDRAFRGAAAFVAYSIIWILIGVGIIIFGIYFGFVVGTQQRGLFGMTYTEPNWGVAIISIIVGVIIIELGTYASWLKIEPEIIAEEVEKRLKIKPIEVQILPEEDTNPH